ncbi:TetR/AcrR family transcriptional regulator [Pseudonocardia broussonetiae]|uniref:TetR/AcrR family transcriptional regulator n=1 Tax=Pseudonocardia broussonetiae TaxID=2736640 RepID=A0A6M6JD62_9PSEU|nr:TetR/AcrR family transcriptional regulator [Pseudonocardia broussonetiae]QJY44772.1 TetR/AcrR family transcriptional regulator [Pseudonocardia broussonetiae]
MAKAGSAERGADAAPGARRRKQHARRQEVLDTAARMFFERGYEATTTQDIGAALGLLKGSVYYYISSKQDLLFELVQQYHDDTREHFEPILASDAPPVDKLRELIMVDTAHTARNLERSTLFYTEWRSLPQERRSVIVAERARHESAVQEWIVAAQAAGAIRPEVDAKIASFAIFGMVNSVYRWFTPDGRKSAEEIGRDFSDLVLGGLLTAAD